MQAALLSNSLPYSLLLCFNCWMLTAEVPMNSTMAILGIGTDVGKTIVSAIAVSSLQAHYWKPIQSGNLEFSDTDIVKSLIKKEITTYPEAYRLKSPLSPHHAAKMDGIEIDINQIRLPIADRPLVIEGAGGLMVPINEKNLMIDLFAQWRCECILVSKHYLGSINHTLLSIEALRHRQMKIRGIIFNGSPLPETEDVILETSKVPMLGRLEPEPHLNAETIQRYADLWKPSLI
jgi:dethiobiotin synthetase